MYPIDLFNIRDTQDERTRRRLGRFHRRSMRIMSRRKRVRDLFNT